jgi:serine/threonine-protein kinase
MSNLVGQMLGQYRLVEQIGQGGMATVYRALDTRSLQDVAIKILSSSAVGDRRYVRRFRREAGFVKNVLRHPNIVPVLDYNELRGLVYLVMPYIAGETLHERIAQAGSDAGGALDRSGGEALGRPQPRHHPPRHASLQHHHR